MLAVSNIPTPHPTILWFWVLVSQIICAESGDVAQLCRQTQSLLAPAAPLTIQQVYSVLRKIRYALHSFGNRHIERCDPVVLSFII